MMTQLWFIDLVNLIIEHEETQNINITRVERKISHFEKIKTRHHQYDSFRRQKD